MDVDERPRPWLAAFLALAMIWGCSFAFVKVSLTAFAPVQVSFGRMILGAIALLAISAVTRTPLPRGRRVWMHLTVAGALLNSVPLTLFAYGQQYVSSVLAGLINAGAPLLTLVVILLAFPEEKPTPQRVIGLLVGFVGVGVVLGLWRGFAAGEWYGVVACLGAIASYGIAFPYVRRYLSGSGVPPVALATGQVSMATLQMTPVLLWSGVAVPGEITSSVVLSMLGVGVLGSGIAYVLNFHIIAAAGASSASTVTYVIPVVTVAVGWAVLDERVYWNHLVGGAIVLLGVATAQGFVTRSRVPELRA